MFKRNAIKTTCTVLFAKSLQSSARIFQQYQQQFQYKPYHASLITYKKSNEKEDKKSGGGKNNAAPAAEFDMNKYKTHFDKVMEATKKSFQQIQVGRANPALLENLKVKLPTNDVVVLKSIANVAVKSPRLLAVNVFDQSHATAVSRSIAEADLGFEPMTKANSVEVPIPKMTKEIREGVVKNAKKIADATKEKLRGVRRDGMQELKDLKKSMPEDQFFKLEEQVQKLLDGFIKQVDVLLEAKEKEIMAN